MQYHLSQPNLSQTSSSFKFLVSTDTHLGYKCTHPIRSNDSFEAFEEILDRAIALNVDFLLLGGDLFHEINPSQETLYKCLKILREKIFGDKMIDYETFWEDSEPNYANENMNIRLPIFIIHGNHDYPSNEFGNLSILDLLEAGNYINYFGKFNNYDNIEVVPILFHKGNTKIALYGLGHIKDIRLVHLLETNKIKFKPPPASTTLPATTNYFCILLLHQNRFKGMKNWGYNSCVHLKMLPSFFNLIIWGHEHESIPDIQQTSESSSYLYQPGSSIPTSLIEAEAKQKHAGLFTFKDNEFCFEPVFLNYSQRDLLFQQIQLSSILPSSSSLPSFPNALPPSNFLLPTAPPPPLPNKTPPPLVSKNKNDLIDMKPLSSAPTPLRTPSSNLPPAILPPMLPTIREEEKQDWVENYLERCIDGILEEYSRREVRNLKKLPLVRLKVEYSGFDIIRIQRLETKFKGKVANEGEILRFWKRKLEHKTASNLTENPNLSSRFSDCFKNKSSFNTIGKDSTIDIRCMYESELRRSTFSVLSLDMFLDKLPTLSLRNKQAKLNDFLTSTLENLEGGLNREQKEGVESKNLDFFRKIDEFCKGVRKGMDGGDFKTIREMNEKVLKLPIDNDRNGYDYAEILKRNVIEGMQKQLKSKFQNESLLNEQSKTTESNRNQPTIDVPIIQKNNGLRNFFDINQENEDSPVFAKNATNNTQQQKIHQFFGGFGFIEAGRKGEEVEGRKEERRKNEQVLKMNERGGGEEGLGKDGIRKREQGAEIKEEEERKDVGERREVRREEGGRRKEGSYQEEKLRRGNEEMKNKADKNARNFFFNNDCDSQSTTFSDQRTFKRVSEEKREARGGREQEERRKEEIIIQKKNSNWKKKEENKKEAGPGGKLERQMEETVFADIELRRNEGKKREEGGRREEGVMRDGIRKREGEGRNGEDDGGFGFDDSQLEFGKQQRIKGKKKEKEYFEAGENPKRRKGVKEEEKSFDKKKIKQGKIFG